MSQTCLHLNLGASVFLGRNLSPTLRDVFLTFGSELPHLIHTKLGFVQSFRNFRQSLGCKALDFQIWKVNQLVCISTGLS